MDHVDSKFIGLVSPKLQKFKRVKADLYNFRCPICGDSKKNKSKTRGYLYAVKANTNFKCHNCGASMSLNNFLKHVDPAVHKQYVMEKFVNSLKPTFDDTKHDEERIIIPLYYEKNLIGLQGRSINPNPVKYITVMLDDDAPKIYGLDTIRRDAPVYITEGPFDSTFIRNAIAMCGADLDISRWGISNPVWIYDNEPRNREITNRISKTIDSGQSVVIWPESIDDKDINDMVMNGLDVQSVIESNTYSGLEAKLKFTTWKKI
jgi:transcription elongation factor Elf1